MNENDCEKNGIEIFRDRFFDYFLNIQAKRILTKKRMKMSKVWSVPSKKKRWKKTEMFVEYIFSHRKWKYFGMPKNHLNHHFTKRWRPHCAIHEQYKSIDEIINKFSPFCSYLSIFKETKKKPITMHKHNFFSLIFHQITHTPYFSNTQNIFTS